MVKKLCRLNQRYYWLRNFLLEQISSHISFIVTFCEPFLFPDIALYTTGTIIILEPLWGNLQKIINMMFSKLSHGQTGFPVCALLDK